MGSLIVSKNYQHFKETLICLSSGSSSERPWPIPCMILGASSFYWHFFFYEIGSLKLLSLPHTAYPPLPIPKQQGDCQYHFVCSSFSLLPSGQFIPYFCKRQFHIFCGLYVCEDKYGQHKIIAGKKTGHYLRYFVQADQDA